MFAPPAWMKFLHAKPEDRKKKKKKKGKKDALHDAALQSDDPLAEPTQLIPEENCCSEWTNCFLGLMRYAVCPRWKHCTGISIGLLISAFLVVFSAFYFLPLMQHLERVSLRNKILLQSSTMNADDWSSFQVERSPHNLYMYNFTNLYDVLMTGAKPHFAQIGPLEFTRIVYRLDINETLTGQISCNELTMYEISTPATAALLEQKIVTVNWNYLGGMAYTARVKSIPDNPSARFVMPLPPALSDADFHVRNI